ncbi:MAG: hypothetical protein KF912_05005 [Phycisphaeraceae bacterium]|nr:hypothetical protein [Phycisphaeraceae bacterium]MBX3366657.1 hypothetical protein [Phycisphaeraceae bacterium]
MAARSVLTIGTFDGVHMGHRALIERAGEIARGAGARVVALAFDPHPMTRLRPASAPARLTTFGWREALLREAGADEVVRLNPFDGLLELTPEAFVSQIVSRYAPIAIVEGDDFRFGKGRTGDVDVLRRLGEQSGFETVVVAPVEVVLGDASIARASSTGVRRLLLSGRASDAARVLGRPYRLMGKVVRGDRRGRTIGYPTANLDSELMLPADGVYAARAQLADGRVFGAALSVGTKPTFTDAPSRACEAFFLDAPRATQGDPRIEGLDEYGWALSLDIVGWVREQVRFHGLEPLLGQMARDCDRIREMLRGAERVAEEVA